MKTYLLEREQLIRRSKEETFEFFGDAFNLEKITPPFLKFRITTPSPIAMKAGALIDYQLSLFGIPFKWRTLIETWDEGDKFVDTQIKGPYSLWHHTHTFEDLAGGETLMKDIVRYRIPFGVFGRIAHWLFIKKTLDAIFDYRAEATSMLLNGDEKSTPMKATGMTATAFSGD
jgi:ligand-binding SRPBCC domain-containing protein